MIDELFSTLAPHYCYGCAKVGSLLCDNCKYDITHETTTQCLICGGSTSPAGVCVSHAAPYCKAWCAGERSGILQQLIDGFKFEYIRAASTPLADVLLATVPELPSATIVVPVPTAAAHIRERGFDHTLLIARRFARARRLACRPVLQRITHTKQRGAGREVRIAQAKTAFRVRRKLDAHAPYLLIDDVVTTGATLHYGAKTLLDAGATEVWVASVSRQPLD